MIDILQLIFAGFIVACCVVNIIFITQFRNKGKGFLDILLRYKLIFVFTLLFVAIAPPLLYLFNFIFGSPTEIIYSQFLIAMIFTGVGIIGMFLIILVLRNRTKKIVDKFVPYIPDFKREEAHFHLWESFNSNHAYYFSIFTGGTFFLLTYDSSIVVLAFQSLGFTDIFSILIWLIGNYLFLYFFGIAFGLSIWVSFHSTHDYWHAINTSENLPKELTDKYGNFKFVAGQVLIIASIIVYGAAFWWIGDLFLQATVFKLLFRFTLLAFVGISMFIGLYYLIRSEFTKKEKIINKD